MFQPPTMLLLSPMLAAAIPATAQAPAEGRANEVQKQIEQLVEQQNKLADQYNAILRKLKQDETLVALDEAIAAAKAKLAKAEADNAALAAARAAEKDARKAVEQAVEEKLKAHPEAGRLLDDIAQLQTKRAEHLWQIELAKFQLEHPLSPVNRALASDKELSAAKAKLDAATISERSDAKAAYDELRKQKLEELAEAQRLQAIIEDSTAAAARARQSLIAVEERLAPIRKQIERVESKRIEEARAKVADALNSEKIVELRQDVNDRVTEYNTRIEKLIAENEEAVRLKAEYDRVRAKIKALRASASRRSDGAFRGAFERSPAVEAEDDTEAGTEFERDLP